METDQNLYICCQKGNIWDEEDFHRMTSFQEKVMSLAREKMEVEKQAALLGKEVENVKVFARR